jgi:hypothetical protein
MRGFIFVVMTSFLLLGVSQAQAAGSCSVFAKITSYDADSKAITIQADKKTNERKFFPKPEGSPATSKLPTRCKSRTLKQDGFPVKTTGGRMSITQVRENFSNKMLNDTDDGAWVPAELQKLVDSKSTVLVVLRQPPGGDKKAPHAVTTVYLPITDAELKEIERLEAQAVDD